MSQSRASRTKAYRTFPSLSKKTPLKTKTEETSSTATNRTSKWPMNWTIPRSNPTIRFFKWSFWANPSLRKVSQRQPLSPRVHHQKSSHQISTFMSSSWVGNWVQESSGRSSSQGTFYWKFRHIKTGFLFALKRIDKNNIDHKLIIQLIR